MQLLSNNKFKAMRLRHLTFTGINIEPISIDLQPGLNIIYGASNAGKSYILEVLNFMLGGDKPSILKEGADYTDILLGIEFSEYDSITIHRERKGGAITVYEGLSENGIIFGRKGIVLAAKHGQGKNGSLSELIMGRAGITQKKVASTLAAKLLPLSIRQLIPYVLIDELRMFSPLTPTVISPKNSSTLDKNVFKALITGQDDSHINTVPDQTALNAGKAGKIELLIELINILDQKIGKVTYEEISSSHERLSSQVETVGDDLAIIQQHLDEQVRLRRATLDQKHQTDIHGSQLSAMEKRFVDLNQTYVTDIRRLEAIEEGGFLLCRFENQPCPMCGAEPGSQHTPHLPGNLEKQQISAQAEILKIQRDQENLLPTLANLSEERNDLIHESRDLSKVVEAHDLKIFELRPLESKLRDSHRGVSRQLEECDRYLAIFKQRDDFSNRLALIEDLKIGKQLAEGLFVGISDDTGAKFTAVVKDVLEAWGYPEIQTVTWNQTAFDFEVNGVPRGQNGKGVKAIFHSAFVIACLIYCRQNNLPHPGLVVLDSPLVTYRKPILYKRHGELQPDEAEIAKTMLDVKFYEHLASLSAIGQFLVIENNDPPAEIRDKAKVLEFSGQNGNGRKGLFPPLRN